MGPEREERWRAAMTRREERAGRSLPGETARGGEEKGEEEEKLLLSPAGPSLGGGGEILDRKSKGIGGGAGFFFFILCFLFSGCPSAAISKTGTGD